ncbi:MAG TPA: 5'-nucleotidase C-terminal domain-containing protein, partial [bacterium]|nr:5'-nucleotidase C-terminal domain-containing protein [bacterium]
IDAFVGGHTHQYMANVIDGVPVIESGAFGVAFGRIDLDVDLATRKVVHVSVMPPQGVCRDVLVDTGSCASPKPGQNPRPLVEPATFLGGPIVPSEEIEHMLAPFRQEVAELKGEVVATAERAIGTASRSDASEIGALVTEEMRAATKRYADVPDADFAVQNTGGLRGGLPRGPVTYGAVYEVLPFDNVLATFDATGEQLEALFTTATRTGRIFQTAGLIQEISGSGEATTVKLFDEASGKRLLAKKKYTVVWNDFLANGGDGTRDALPGVTQRIHSSRLLREAVVEGLKAKKAPLNSAKEPLLDPKKPRIRRT